MSELYKLGIKAAAEGLSRKDFSSVELTQAIMDFKAKFMSEHA